MKVSIVVPAYNEEKKIESTLKSLVSQRYPHFELIVVDNNSTDRTAELARAYTAFVVNEPQQGYMAAAARGGKEATGDLLTFCDSDTLYPQDWLTKVVAEFQKNPKVVAVYGTCTTYDGGLLQNRWNSFVYTVLLVCSRFFGMDNTSGFNFVMKRDVYLKAGGYDPNYTWMSPDIELGKRLKPFGKIVFKPSIYVQTSFRRFQKDGVIKTFWMFLCNWYLMIRNKKPMSYEGYNKSFD